MDQPGVKPKRGRKKLYLFLLIIVVVIGVIVIVIKGLSSPAEGTINNSANTSPPPKPRTTGHYSDKYLTFDYPGGFKVVPTQKPAAELDAVSLLSSDHPSIYAAIGLVQEQLANDSGLNYRQMHPELYKKISDSPTQKVFSRGPDSPEYTGFITHDGMVLALSLSSISTINLSDDYNFIADSLVWK